MQARARACQVRLRQESKLFLNSTLSQRIRCECPQNARTQPTVATTTGAPQIWEVLLLPRALCGRGPTAKLCGRGGNKKHT